MALPRVCVLGDPRFRCVAGDVIVTGRPARVLVALVGTEAGLSLDQLADLVWSGHPPKSGRAALHVYLGALRKLLADAAPSGLTIERHGERYVPSRSGWEVDVELVHYLARRAVELSSQSMVLLTPMEGEGSRPVFSWESVPDADQYFLILLDPEGAGYWSWEGEGTEIVLGGVPVLEDGIAGPQVSPGMTWSVTAADVDGQVIALSEFRPISP